MNEERKGLTGGGPLVVEDLDVTFQSRTYRFPVRRGLLGMLWVNWACRHNRVQPVFGAEDWCDKCWTILPAEQK